MEKIDQILDSLYDRVIEPIEAKEQLLDLFDVSQRSELLKAFYAYIDDKWALGMLTDKVDEVIEGFEKAFNCG